MTESHKDNLRHPHTDTEITGCPEKTRRAFAKTTLETIFPRIMLPYDLTPQTSQL